MKALHAILGAIWFTFAGFASAAADEDLSAKLQPVLEAFEREAVVVQSAFDEARAAVLTETSAELQGLQDAYAAAAKLDEAVAVRDQIRSLRDAADGFDRQSLPDDARKTMQAYDEKIAALEKKRDARLKEAGARIAAPLQTLVDRLTRESKLDDALAVRDVMRRMTGVVTAVESDPGSISGTNADVGAIRYYEVRGTDGGSIWGTDLYTGDSQLSTAAVHVGALKVGESGVVRVTVLPGLEKYRASIRNGVESMPYNSYPLSYRVERAYGIFRAAERTPDDNPFGAPAPRAVNPFGR